MPFIVCGISHQTAPVALRERLAIEPLGLPQALGHAAVVMKAEEAVMLSTCNRSEWYALVPENINPTQWLSELHDVPLDELSPHSYCHQDLAAIHHLLRVSCGLDSMVLGEPQIFGQLKDAFEWANDAGCVGPLLQFIFQQAFAATKRVRNESQIGCNPVSMASVALNLAKCIFEDLNSLNIVLVGVGEMTVSALKYFNEQGASSITLANRTLAKAEEVVSEHNAVAIGLDQLPKALLNADIVITATSSKTPVITTDMINNALKTQRLRPFLLLDLAVPRDIEAEVESLDSVYLYNIDDLRKMAQEGLDKRKAAAIKAEKLIEAEATHCMKLLSENQFESIICHYREQVNMVRDEVVTKAVKQLKNGAEPEAVLSTMARALTNKLMHHPSVELRQASYHGHTEFIDIAKRLLGIGDHKPSEPN